MDERSSLYFNCKTGVSGDMVLGSLVDLGVDIQRLKQELLKLKLDEFEIEAREEDKYGTRGINVYILQKKHNHGNGHNHENHETGHNHRSYREIEKIISTADFSEGIKRRALSIYKAIAEAEASVHETDIETVHFHEVGRDVALLNIVGAAVCMELLNVGNITCSELHDGTGFIECSHGLIPVPVPAVQELFKGSGLKLVQEKVNAEMVTPTGLGILKGLQAVHADEIPTVPLRIGYGFGKKDIGRLSMVTAYLLDKSFK